MRELPTAERVRELLLYDPGTGTFKRQITVAGNAKIGSYAGTRHVRGYWTIGVDGIHYKAHILAWLYMTGAAPIGQIDHINRNPSDNRWANLRVATHKQNTANASLRRDNSSGAKGIRRFGGKWQVRLGNGGRIHVGTFISFDDAVAAYRAAAMQEYGDFAS